MDMDALTRWRPLGGVPTLRDEMDQLFNRFLGREWEGEAGLSPWFPPANISETNDNVVVTAEIPGLDPKEIDISVTGDLLTIKGEKKQEKEDKGESYHRVERSYGAFSRSFRLPGPVVVDKVAADYKNGLLRITLPKSEEAKRREVKIRVG
jgi:HSP20 family protein